MHGLAARGAEQIEEVTVTAEKRAESLQDVPMSLTAVGEAALREQHVTSFFDYGTRVPNVGFGYTGDGIATSRTISIRGISGDNVTSVYLDETPLPDSIDPRILDIERIEVLRGPQGTLYGARSMAGVVRIITKPVNVNQFSGSVHAEVSDTAHTQRPNYSVESVLNVPLVADRAALRLTGFYDREAGYYWRRYCSNPATAGVTCFPASTDPALTTTAKDQGAIDSFGGSASVTLTPADGLTVTPRFLFQKAIYDGIPLADVPLGAPPIGFGVPPLAGPLPALTPSSFVQGRSSIPRNAATTVGGC